MDITLYYTPQTRSVRPRWLLEELGVPYQLEHIDLYAGGGESEAYKAINPLGAVPALKVDDDVMLESGAICHWLTDIFIDKGMAPHIDDRSRMAYEQWMMFSQATLEMQPWLIFLHSRVLPESQRVEAIVPWALRYNRRFLKMLNDELTGKNFLLGDQFTTADIMVGSTLMWLAEALNKYPDLIDYVQRLKQRPAYIRAINEDTVMETSREETV
ncbi:MAG: glutathione S-transferase family protein [Gammaproteobacteria bacterium]|nr:glutathione S-transferase family protein [Gammaproteobacteria bacterium]